MNDVRPESNWYENADGFRFDGRRLEHGVAFDRALERLSMHPVDPARRQGVDWRRLRQSKVEEIMEGMLWGTRTQPPEKPREGVA